MLLTVGDSFTVKRYDGDYPWSYQLADKLKMKHLNIAQEGESNSYIFRNTIWALTENPDISIVVLSLTNWDRFELPYDDYGMNKSGIDERTKTFKPRDAHAEIRTNNVSKTYMMYYNSLFYVDQTASYLIAINQLCKSKNVELIVTQPLLPFNVRIDAVVKGDLDFLLKKTMSPHGINYIKNFSLFQHVDKDIFCGFDPTPRMILFGEEKDNPNKPLFDNFTRNFPENCMGYHNKYLYKGGYESRKKWDGHPNIKGHKIISELIYENIQRK